MKGLLVCCSILLFIVPAHAVIIKCVNEGASVVRIDYDSSDETIKPRAFALDITVTGGAIISRIYDYKIGDSNAASPGFGIFPYSMQIDGNGTVLDYGTPVIAGGAGTSSVTLGMASRYSGKNNAPPVKGTLCRILVDANNISTVTVKVTPNTGQGGIVLENAKQGKFTSTGVTIGITVNKCTVIAGYKPSTDSITASGSIDASADKFIIPGSVIVTISSADIASPLVQTFPVDSTTFKSGSFKGAVTQKPLKSSFTFNSKTSKFSFSARNVSLNGLSSPVHIDIKIGSYVTAADIDETIINGKIRPIPIKLMMGVKDSLRVDKVSVRRSTKANSDLLIVKGGFAVAATDTNMVNSGLSVTLGLQTFTIPANSFKAGKEKFTCSRIALPDGSIAAANFNFRTCTFTLTIQKTKIAAPAGDASLTLNFASFNQFEVIKI